MTNGAHPSAGDRLATLFPAPDAPAARPPWWGSRRRIAVAALVVVVASVALATRAFGSSGPSYRTAAVDRRSIAAQLDGTATIEPVSQANVAFPISGTVASVNVNVGDTVTVGQQLASLDPASLLETLHTKQQALAQAQLALQNALSGQSSGSSGGAGSSGSSSSSSGVASPRAARSGSTPHARLVAFHFASPDPEIASAQQAVIAAQHAVDVAIANADNALHNATNVCAAIGNDPNTPPTSSQVSACQQALSAVQDAQGAVRDKQNALVDASNKLDDLLQQRADQTPAPTTTTPTTTAPPAPTAPPATAGNAGNQNAAPSAPSGAAPGGGESRSGAGGSGGAGSGARTGGGSSPSAADLAADQQAVDAATADVAAAEQAMNQATIGSPIDGTVVAVNVAAGDTVDAASSTANIVVQGAGGYEVATTVSVDRVGEVAVGQDASLVPDGAHKAISGKVAYVSVVPTTSSSSSDNQSSGTPTYLVVVGLHQSDANLKNGSTGTVSIVTGSATAALAVPTSAVTTFGNRHTVQVLESGNPRRVTVTVGAVGDTWTEIKSGLTAGQQVVLADVSASLPSSATQSTTQNGAGNFPGRFFSGGGFGGGGFPTGPRRGD